VSAVPRSFSPALGQHTTLSFTTRSAGAVTVTVVDRDAVPIRVLANSVATTAGRQSFRWDGRNDEGAVVPDEAWSFKIDLRAGGVNESYFPASETPSAVEVSGLTYDRSNRIIRYILAVPARVHVQAGTATIAAASGTADGPVLKTVVDRQPRVGGSIVEQWNGMDESGSTFVPQLRDFVIGVAATALPETAVITTGNRSETFLDSISAQRRPSLLKPQPGTHPHHAGLTAVQDVAPKLAIEWANEDEHRGRNVAADALHLTMRLSGPSVPSFLSQRGSLQLFLDGARISESAAATNPADVTVPIDALKEGTHLLAVNWATAAGPVAVNTLTFDITPKKHATR
jgi:hypothetical protein